MRTIRFLIAAIIGGVLTLVLSSLTFLLVKTGFTNVAKRTPDWWGRSILLWCNEIIMGKVFIAKPKKVPKPGNDLTLVICNHPRWEDIPSLIGLLARWGYSASIVSKVENLKGATGFFVGKNFQKTGRGVFISQSGGTTSREELQRAIKHTSAILIFPDKHRPTPQALERDRERFPNSGLTHLCVPRAGGVYSIIDAALNQGRTVKVINVTWHATPETIATACEDVTENVMASNASPQTLKPETAVRSVLLTLWQEKEKFMKKYS